MNLKTIISLSINVLALVAGVVHAEVQGQGGLALESHAPPVAPVVKPLDAGRDLQPPHHGDASAATVPVAFATLPEVDGGEDALGPRPWRELGETFALFVGGKDRVGDKVAKCKNNNKWEVERQGEIIRGCKHIKENKIRREVLCDQADFQQHCPKLCKICGKSGKEVCQNPERQPDGWGKKQCKKLDCCKWTTKDDDGGSPKSCYAKSLKKTECFLSKNDPAPPVEDDDAAPSGSPNFLASMKPSGQPTTIPSTIPTTNPSLVPNTAPPAISTDSPSIEHSDLPSTLPSVKPSGHPTMIPSTIPTMNPSLVPSTAPSAMLTDSPSVEHSDLPSTLPSAKPSGRPTMIPSTDPTLNPSAAPSVSPSSVPTDSPSVAHSGSPSVRPSFKPSEQPTTPPSPSPTKKPTHAPTVTGIWVLGNSNGESCTQTCNRFGKTCDFRAIVNGIPAWNYIDTPMEALAVLQSLGVPCGSIPIINSSHRFKSPYFVPHTGFCSYAGSSVPSCSATQPNIWRLCYCKN